MKKLIATTLLCTAAGLAAFGQGTVNFANVGVGLNAPVFLNDGVTKAASGYTAILMAGASATSLSQIATASVSSGYFLGGTQVIPGVAGGATADILIEIYQTTSGSFASAKSANVANTWAWSGGGTPFALKLADPTATPPQTPAALTGLTPLTLNSVPEPSTFALVGLGAAAMLIFRRRK